MSDLNQVFKMSIIHIYKKDQDLFITGCFKASHTVATSWLPYFLCYIYYLKALLQHWFVRVFSSMNNCYLKIEQKNSGLFIM